MKAASDRLWDKGASIDALVHRFTVGDDPHWDAHLVHWDCVASAAHVRTLQDAGLLTVDECGALVAELAKIDALANEGRFVIAPEQEDCHTAIEAHLTARLGTTGAKVHCARSRNDQVAVAMRLFLRHHAFALSDAILSACHALLEHARRDGHIAIPGYTHLQPAMPSSVGQWCHAHLEGLLEQAAAVNDLLDRLDRCPLGSAAGFGVPIPLDRALTARLLGFSRVQRSPIDVQNSRGRMEMYALRVAADVGRVLEKLSWDLILYASNEFGLVRLPEALTTGSSIMPQKRNPDVLELLRGRSARLRARLFDVEQVSGKLPSSYHRDLQLTKEPAIRTALELPEMLAVATRVIGGVEWLPEVAAARMGDELYATHAALALVQQGTPFRDAYRQVAEQVRGGAFRPESLSEWRRSDGKVDASMLDEASAELEVQTRKLRARCAHVQSAERAIFETS